MVKKIIYAILAIGVIFILTSFFLDVYFYSPTKVIKDVFKGRDLSQEELFKEGRLFRLKLTYMGFLPVGEAEIRVGALEVLGNGQAYKLTAIARTSGLISRIYQATAKVTSYMDKTKLHSLKYLEEIETKDEIKTKEIIFDQVNHVATRKDRQYKILPDTQDGLSSFFSMLSRDFKVGGSFSSFLITKEANYEFQTKVLDKKDDVWKVAVSVGRQDKSSSHGGSFIFNVLDGKCKIPLSIKGWTQAGLVTARLIEVN